MPVPPDVDPPPPPPAAAVAVAKGGTYPPVALLAAVADIPYHLFCRNLKWFDLFELVTARNLVKGGA